MVERQGDEALGDWDISRDAPYLDSIPDAGESIYMCGWMAPSAILRR